MSSAGGRPGSKPEEKRPVQIIYTDADRVADDEEYLAAIFEDNDEDDE